MNNLLKNKNILVGVTGSIAIYKSLELIRLFVKAGANVRVVLSDEALKFISPITFEALSSNKVLYKESEDWSSDLNHIGVGEWADIFVIAPATANTINKLSNGIADNLLLQSALAFDRVKIIAPAANTKMYENPVTQASFKMLKLLNYKIVEPQSKVLVCKVEGKGALADVEDIFFATVRELLKDDFWENRKVVVTGGGTIERIDSVRYISNFSSGKMAKSLALALYLKGASVCFLTTKKFDDLPKEIYQLDVESALEMKEYLTDCIRSAKKGVLTKPTLMDDSIPQNILKKPYLFMAAAVSDYTPKFPQEGKLKKEQLGDEWTLVLKRNEDILKTIDKNKIVSIGFKAEKDEEKALENAKNMLVEKNLDAVCLNVLKENNDFGSDLNEIDFITKSGVKKLSLKEKLLISFEILEEAKRLDDNGN